MIKNTHALTASLLASVLLGGCNFQNKTNLLLPTAPSATNNSSSTGSSSGSSSSSSNSSSSSSSAGPSVSIPAASGTWASGAIAGLPNITSCSDLQWQISSLTSSAISGSVSAVCGGVVNVSANITGQMASSDTVNLTASGQAVGLGITCPFSVNGTGHLEGNDAMRLDYQGMTCLGPVNGSELLHRRSPSTPPPAAPDPSPEAQPEPQQPAPSDDGTFGCAGTGDNYHIVECIHSHINPHNEFEAFEVTKRVAWALRGDGAGLLIKNTGENIVPWKGYIFAAGRICYPDGHIIKVISDVGPGGANGPSWQDNGYVDRSLYVPALDPTN